MCASFVLHRYEIGSIIPEATVRDMLCPRPAGKSDLSNEIGKSSDLPVLQRYRSRRNESKISDPEFRRNFRFARPATLACSPSSSSSTMPLGAKRATRNAYE